MAEVEILNANGMTINKVISDDIKKVNGTAYITKEACDGLYKPKNNGEVNVKSINYTPAQEQKIQFSLTEPYTIRFAGWFVVNPDDRAAETWFISINDRPMFHSDDDGNISVSILVHEGDVITSTTEYDRYGYLMPCESELSDWRDSSLKSDTVDIWKSAVRTDGTVADQWLDNGTSSSWYVTNGSTYKTLVSYVNGDEAFDVNGNHLFYIQTENIRTGHYTFRSFALESFNGDMSNLTDGYMMFYGCTSLGSFNGDLSKLTNGTYMFGYSESLESFNGDLSSLISGYGMFFKTALTSWDIDLSNMENGYQMFYMSALTSFNGDLSSLISGYYMFTKTALTSWDIDLSNMENGRGMFYDTPLESFNGDLSNLENGEGMFRICRNLTSFNGNLSKLTNGYYMFYYCDVLTSFHGDLSSLTDGSLMFTHCKLDLESVQNIASTINTVSSGNLTLGIAKSIEGNSDLTTALNTISSKGWTISADYYN